MFTWTITYLSWRDDKHLTASLSLKNGLWLIIHTVLQLMNSTFYHIPDCFNWFWQSIQFDFCLLSPRSDIVLNWIIIICNVFSKLTTNKYSFRRCSCWIVLRSTVITWEQSQVRAFLMNCSKWRSCYACLYLNTLSAMVLV